MKEKLRYRLTIEGDTNFTTELFLVLFSVDIDSFGMGVQQAVTDNPGFSAGVTNGILGAVTGTARSVFTGAIAQSRAAPGFVECDPVLDLGTKSLKADTSVVGIVSDELLFVEETAVALHQIVRQIPVEQCDERLNAGLVQIIEEFGVELQALLVHRIISTTQRNDTRPEKVVARGSDILVLFIESIKGIVSTKGEGTYQDKEKR